MRMTWVACAVLAVSATARAGVTVPPFAAPDDLSIFAPTVAQALAASLDLAGVDVSAGAPVSGKIESIDREHVRLRASVGGKSVVVEGELEKIDRLTAELGARLAPQLPATARRPPGTPPRITVATRSAPSGSAPIALPAGPPVPAAEKDPPPPVEKDKDKDKVVAVVTPPPSEKVANAPTPPPAATPPATTPPPVATTTPAPPTPPADEHRFAAPPVATPPEYAAPPPPVYAAPAPYAAPRRGWRSLPSPGFGAPVARAVLHTIGSPEGCQLGQWATYAARDVLERRYRVQTVSGACGFIPPAAASSEAARMRVRSVVMAAFNEPVRLEPAGNNMLRPVGHLRIIVVRDGQVVFDRTPTLNPRLTQVPDPSRAAYDLVEEAFGRAGAELQSVLYAP
jgi:hypothetical protein